MTSYSFTASTNFLKDANEEPNGKLPFQQIRILHFFIFIKVYFVISVLVRDVVTSAITIATEKLQLNEI